MLSGAGMHRFRLKWDAGPEIQGRRTKTKTTQVSGTCVVFEGGYSAGAGAGRKKKLNQYVRGCAKR